MRIEKIEVNLFKDMEFNRLYFEETFQRLDKNTYLFLAGREKQEHIKRNFELFYDFSGFEKKQTQKEIEKDSLLTFSDKPNEEEAREIFMEILANECLVYDFSEVEKVANFFGLTVTKKFKEIESVGYYQRDYAKVIVFLDDYRTELKKHINNLFWDAPLAGSITVTTDNDEVTFYLDEIISDEYKSCDSINSSILEFFEKKYPKKFKEIEPLLKEQLKDSYQYI